MITLDNGLGSLTMLDAKSLWGVLLVVCPLLKTRHDLTSIASGLGPTQTRPALPTSLAKSAFSDKKPYPGMMA
jgi:hypothetical protein